MGEDAGAEIKEKGLAFRNQGIKVSPLTAQNIGEDLACGIIGFPVTGETIGHDGETVGKIRIHGDSGRSKILELDLGSLGQSFGGDVVKELLDR